MTDGRNGSASTSRPAASSARTSTSSIHVAAISASAQRDVAAHAAHGRLGLLPRDHAGDRPAGWRRGHAQWAGSAALALAPVIDRKASSSVGWRAMTSSTLPSNTSLPVTQHADPVGGALDLGEHVR